MVARAAIFLPQALMRLEPGYGETPLSDDELSALLPHVLETLGTPISKTDVFDLESAVLQDVAEGLLAAVFRPFRGCRPPP